MSDKYYEDPLESLLDEQSDEGFGLPEFHNKYDHGARETQHGNLKTWTAEEFSSIYVRFYPHLVRHANRYLSNEVQAEEVVQDAFLYMMTALPELDTELGVLKFMKWKVRLLALDVIRATPNRKETLVDSFDDEHSAEETDRDVERADDLAIIGAALAKLKPRHREALIATVYEEKSSAEVAAQMQLSENAARQLVFRARTAFKHALVGEAEVAGKTISEILSIATRKHAIAIGKVATTTGILAMLFGASVILQDGFSKPIDTLAGPIDSPVSLAEAQSSSQAGIPDENDDKESAPADSVSEDNQIAQQQLGIGENESVDVELPSPGMQVDSQPMSSESADLQNANLVFSTPRFVNDHPSTTYFSSPVVLDAETISSPTLSGGVAIRAQGPGNLSALMIFDTSEKKITGVTYILSDGSQEIYGYPRATGEAIARDETRTTITHTGSEIGFINLDSAVIKEQTGLDGSTATISLELDETGIPAFASLTVTEKTTQNP